MPAPSEYHRVAETLAASPPHIAQRLEDMERRLAQACDGIVGRLEARFSELREDLDERMQTRLGACAEEWKECRELLHALSARQPEAAELATQRYPDLSPQRRSSDGRDDWAGVTAQIIATSVDAPQHSLAKVESHAPDRWLNATCEEAALVQDVEWSLTNDARPSMIESSLPVTFEGTEQFDEFDSQGQHDGQRQLDVQGQRDPKRKLDAKDQADAQRGEAEHRGDVWGGSGIRRSVEEESSEDEGGTPHKSKYLKSSEHDDAEEEGPIQSRVRRCSLARWASEILGEPREHAFLYKVCHSTWFPMAIFFLTMANCAFVAAETHFLVQNTIAEASGSPAPHADSWPQALWQMQRAFFAWLVIEVIVQVLGMRAQYVVGPDRYWNLLDVIILLVSLPEFTGRGASHLRIVRAARTVRSLSALRMIRRSETLQRMLAAMSSAIASLVWAAALIFILVFIVGELMMDGVVSFLEEKLLEGPPQEWRGAGQGLDGVGLLNALSYHYGGASRTWLTLFHAVSGGDWVELASPLSTIDSSWSFLWWLYMTVTLFGFLNVLTGIVVGVVSHPLPDAKAHELAAEAAAQASLTAVIYAEMRKRLGVKGEVWVSHKLFKEFLSSPEMARKLVLHHIDPKAFREAFPLIDVDNDGEVTPEFLARRLLELRGQAKSTDLARLEWNMAHLRTNVKGIEKSLAILETTLLRSSAVGCRDVVTLV